MLYELCAGPTHVLAIFARGGDDEVEGVTEPVVSRVFQNIGSVKTTAVHLAGDACISTGRETAFLSMLGLIKAAARSAISWLGQVYHVGGF